MSLKPKANLTPAVEEKAEECCDWIEKSLGVQLTQAEDQTPTSRLMDNLGNGVILCQLAKLADGALKVKFSTDAVAGTFFARDNISNFLGAIKKMALIESDDNRFEVEDIINGRNSVIVIATILKLARLAADNGRAEPPPSVAAEMSAEGKPRFVPVTDVDEVVYKAKRASSMKKAGGGRQSSDDEESSSDDSSDERRKAKKAAAKKKKKKKKKKIASSSEESSTESSSSDSDSSDDEVAAELRRLEKRKARKERRAAKRAKKKAKKAAKKERKAALRAARAELSESSTEPSSSSSSSEEEEIVVKKKKPKAKEKKVKKVKEESEEEEDDDEDEESEDEPAPKKDDRSEQLMKHRPSAHPNASLAAQAGKAADAKAKPGAQAAPPGTKPTLVNALMFMKKGTPFLKYGKRGYPHWRHFQISSDNRRLEWYSKGKRVQETSIELSSVRSIVLGQTTANFLRHKASDLSPSSFSLIYDERGQTNKTLDVVAMDSNEYRLWTGGLQELIKLNKNSEFDVGKVKEILMKVTVMIGRRSACKIIDHTTGERVEQFENIPVRRNAQSLSNALPLQREVSKKLMESLKKFEKLTKEFHTAKFRTNVQYETMKEIVELTDRSLSKCKEWVNAGEFEMADDELWGTNVDMDSLRNMMAVLGRTF